jgi:phosphoesterase RecJ-like protein
LVGILTDTRGLRADSTTPDVLNLVSDLARAGGDYAGVMQRTLDAVPYRTLQGWGVALSRLQLDDGLAWTVFPLAEKDRLGIDDGYDLDLGNLLSRTSEANIVAGIVELSDGTVKVSMRARPGYNVAGVAKALGGGGHRLAAGYSIEGPLDAAVARTLEMLRAALQNRQTTG